MKYYITIFILIATNITLFSQFGASISGSTEKFGGIDVYYDAKILRIHIGFSAQLNGQKRKVVSEREANYGLSRLNDGDFISAFEIGVSKLISERFTIGGSINIATKKYFTNYRDERFSDGGYSLINRRESIIGGGVNLGYLLSNKFEIFLGFNTIKKLEGGMRFNF